MLRRHVGRIVVASCFGLLAGGPAVAASAYDGTWSLSINTERGPCDPTYSLQVQVNNGIISHPNLVRFKGRIGAGGKAHVSVVVQEKSAAGSGRVTQTSGRGRWTGRSGSERCSGSWTAQRL